MAGGGGAILQVVGNATMIILLLEKNHLYH